MILSEKFSFALFFAIINDKKLLFAPKLLKNIETSKKSFQHFNQLPYISLLFANKRTLSRPLSVGGRTALMTLG